MRKEKSDSGFRVIAGNLTVTYPGEDGLHVSHVFPATQLGDQKLRHEVDFKFLLVSAKQNGVLVEKGENAIRELNEEAARKLEKIDIAPGFRLHNVLGSISTKRFREDVLDQLLQDGIDLYMEKLEAGDKWGAIRVRWSMRGHMLWAMFAGAAAAVVGFVVRKIGAP